MITITSNQPGSPDYKKYIWGDVVKTDRYKDSTLLDFALVPLDGSFVKPVRGTYITINSSKYPYWFTGFVVNDPELAYLGSKNGAPVWGYKYQATSDEYILSIKPLGIMPPFMNMTMGQILKVLIDRLVPGMFNVSGIQNGPLVAQYVVDPAKKFYDVVKDFCESSAYVLKGRNKAITFAPQDDATVVIDGSNEHFTPERLSIKPASSASGVVNDVTVLGQLEPQAHIVEYMVGTGLDAVFPLASGVFGADASVLLDEVFGGSSIDTAKWYVNDQPALYMTLGNGYLLVNGGTSGFGVNITSKSPIPLEGKLRLTHGDWRLTSGSGVIGGLWTGAPSGSLSGCVYGLRVTGGVIKPILGGAVDDTQSLAIDPSKRYVLRTIVEFTTQHRTVQEYKYIGSDGAVDGFGGTSSAGYASWDTLISVVDPTDGSIVDQVRFLNSGSLNSATAFASYIPVASESLDAAFTGVTISVPVNASLELASQCALINSAFDYWTDNTPDGWSNAVGCSKEEVVTDSVFSLKMTAESDGTATIEQPISDLIDTGVVYNMFCRLKKSAGMAAGSVVFSFTGTGIDHTFTVPVSSISTSQFGYFSGKVSDGVDPLPDDLVFKISLSGCTVGQSAYVDAVTVLSEYSSELVGPNEVDGLDGTAPIATITSGQAGNRSSVLGVPQYNPGQSELVFFKDSATLTSDVPPENQIIRLAYRSAGPSIGRAVDRASQVLESQSWKDDGVRSVIRTDIVPRPRTSQECELAAAALVAEGARQHYEGTYEQWSDYFSSEPQAGAILRFDNLSNMAPVDYEEVTEVVTTLSSEKPIERFYHRVSFGKSDVSRALLDKLAQPVVDFQRPAESVSSDPISVEALRAGVVYAGDVTNPRLIAWTPTKLRIDAGEDLTSDDLYFEVRYTDEGWGVDAGLNLVLRTTNRIFDVPRSLRGRTYFIRKARKGNLIQWSEDQTQNNYSGPSRTKAVQAGPDGKTMQVTSFSISAGGSLSGSLSGLSSGTYCGSISIKGTAGARFSLSLGGTPVEFDTTGYWQRVSCTTVGTPSALALTCLTGSGVSVQVTRFSVESGSGESAYTKTTSTLYGPTSRYSACVKVSFPAGLADEFLAPNDPVAPVITVDTTDPNNYETTISIASMPANAARVDYGIQWYQDENGTIADGSPMWIDSFALGKLEATHTYPKTTLSYGRAIARAYNSLGEPSPNAVTSSNVITVPAAEGVDIPEAPQPVGTDWSVGTLESRTTDQGGVQWCGIPITVTIPEGADYVQVWMYRGSSPPASPALYRDPIMAIMKGIGPQTATYWIEKETDAFTLQLVVTASTSKRTTFPGVSTPVKSVTVPAYNLSDPITSSSVEAVPYTVNGQQHYRLRFNGTYNENDPNLQWFIARWRETDSNYLNPQGWNIIWYGAPGKEVTGSPFSVFQPDPPWPTWSTSKYFQAELGTVNWAGEENWSGVLSNLPITTDNKVSASNLKNLGTGVTIDGSNNLTLTTYDSDNVLTNPGFEHGSKGWTFVGGGYTVSDNYSRTGYGAAILDASSAYVLAEPIYSPPDARWYFEVDVAMTPAPNVPTANILLGIIMLDRDKLHLSGGAYDVWVPTTPAEVAASGGWHKLRAWATVPAGASYIQVRVATGAGSMNGGHYRIDNCLLRKIVTARQIAKGTGLSNTGDELIITITDAFTNRHYEFGMTDWSPFGSAAVVSGVGMDGTAALQLTADGGDNGVIRWFKAKPGEKYSCSVWAKTTIANTWPYVQLGFFDINGNWLGNEHTIFPTSSSWTKYNLTTGYAPANTAYIRVAAQVPPSAGSGGGSLWVDNWTELQLEVPGSNVKIGAGLEVVNNAVVPKLGGGVQLDGSLRITLNTSNDFVVDGVTGKLTQMAVNLANAYGFNTNDFDKSSGALAVKAIAVNKLLAGTALFAGQVVFANATNQNSKVVIESTGVSVYGDTNNYVAVSTSGLTVRGGSVNITDGTRQVLLNPSGVSVIHGTNSVVVGASSVDLKRGSETYISLSSNGVDVFKPAYFDDVTAHNISLNAGGGAFTVPSNDYVVVHGTIDTDGIAYFGPRNGYSLGANAVVFEAGCGVDFQTSHIYNLTPAKIGAATSGHTHSGVYAPASHGHTPHSHSVGSADVEVRLADGDTMWIKVLAYWNGSTWIPTSSPSTGSTNGGF